MLTVAILNLAFPFQRMVPPAPTGLIASGHTQRAVMSRALMVLKRVEPLMVDAPVRRKRTNTSPGGGDRVPHHRRVLHGKDGAYGADQDSRPLHERIAALSREAEAIHGLLEREASSAAAGLALDEAFFSSIGISLSGSGGSRSKVSKVPFDRTRLLTSRSLDSARLSGAVVVAPARQESGAGGDATKALGRYSEIGAEI